jgi:hypothetical protein
MKLLRSLAGILALTCAQSFANAEDTPTPPETTSPFITYFTDWFTRVDKSREQQPSWMPPVVTTSPALQEVLRYDITQESLPGGHNLTSYGSGKGLEFIPAEPIQLTIGIPAWQTVNTSPEKSGWADQTFLMKYRFLSANEQSGNYILTGFFGLSVPNGSSVFTTHHFVFTPTAAFGKGWGDFDIQSTLGVSIPDDSGRHTLGTPIALNVIPQYRLLKFLWPETEFNYTYWPNGTHEGLNQLFVTPGIMLGRFPLFSRVSVMVGGGAQLALTDRPLYQRNFVFTARIRF